jgi:hypothetical protein
MKNIWLFLPILLFTSCATITRGVHEKLSVMSDPSGANVQLSSGERGVTPAKFVKLRRTESFTVTVSKPGYAAQTVRVESKFSGTGGTAMAGNVILGGAIGLGVDAGTGAYNSLYPNPVSVHLIPLAKSKLSKQTSSSSEKRSQTKPKAAVKNSPKIETKPKPEATPEPMDSPPPPPPPQPTSTPYVPPTLESTSPENSPTP